MTRITRILRLRNCGIFRDFQWQEDLPEFGRYNLIYGWNGTGKTTLSRLLRALEQRTQPTHGDVTIQIGERKLGGSDFRREEIPIRVFNRDFIQENLFRVDGGQLPPIFVLGAADIEKQREVECLKGERDSARRRHESLRLEKKQADTELDQFCINRARTIKETLRSSGENPYNNYDKSDFRRDAEQMLRSSNALAHLLSEEQRAQLLAQHRAIRKARLSEVSYPFPNFQKIAGTASELLARRVLAAAIQALKDDPELARWTWEGLDLHKRRGADKCLFCEQSLPEDRLSALEAHFSEQYEQLIKDLDNFIQEVDEQRRTAEGVRTPHKAQLYEDLQEGFDSEEANLRAALTKTEEFLGAVADALRRKKDQPFQELSLTVQVPAVDVQVVEKVNQVIREHNQRCDQFEGVVEQARDRLARHMIAEVLEEYRELHNKAVKAKENEESAQQEIEALNKHISSLEREIIAHRQPAEELNKELQSYLGHGEIRLEVKDTGYVILRGNEPAYALSEGEMTAIALLYFLKSLKDRNFDIANGIVVLDDPVSSLDAQALYLAFGFIRERTKDAGQLFILTHNFAFFRQVRNWFRHLKGQRKRNVNKRPARFYMLECVPHEAGRSAALRTLDPLLERYESEYQYLFSRIYQAANAEGPTCLEDNYSLPNMARRMLETFLAFRRPDLSGELSQMVQALEFDEAKKMRMLRFLHTYSHSGGVQEPEHDPSVLAEARSVLSDLLKLMKAEDPKHYEAMVTLVTGESPKEDEHEE